MSPFKIITSDALHECCFLANHCNQSKSEYELAFSDEKYQIYPMASLSKVSLTDLAGRRGGDSPAIFNTLKSSYNKSRVGTWLIYFSVPGMCTTY